MDAGLENAVVALRLVRSENVGLGGRLFCIASTPYCTLSGLFLLGGGNGGLTRPGVVLAVMLPVLVLMLNGLPVTAVGEDWWFILRDRVVLVLAVGLSTSSSVRTRAKQASKAMNELYKRKAQ